MNFLLLGHQRAGTSFFLDLLRHNMEIDTINEPFSMHTDFFRSNEERWGRRDYNQRYLHKDLKNRPITQSFVKDLALWMNSDSERVRGIKETALIEKYDWLVEALGIDKTIILIRDPRAVYYSVIKRNMQNSWWNYKEKVVKYYFSEDINLSDELEVVCRVINQRYRELLNISKKKSKEILVVRLEDVLELPDYYIEEVMGFLNLTYDDNQKAFFNKTKCETRDSTYSNYRKKEDVLDGWKNGINQADRERIEQIFEDILKGFKYI